MPRWLFAGILASACAPREDDPFVQPGLDDPEARPWTKANTWYPEDPDELDAEVEALLDAAFTGEPRSAVAILTPHAGLNTSGPTAAEIYARVEIPARVLVLAPDHWGDGELEAIWPGGPWLVPGHAIAMDDALRDALRTALPELADDRVPFDNHEEEMQLPFLQWLDPDVTIAGIAIYDNSRHHFENWDVARITEWGEALAGVLEAEAEAGRPVLLVTTTDLTHRETLEVNEAEDAILLEHIAALDIEALHEYVTTEEISICGEIPTAILMATLRAMGRESLEIVANGNDFHHSMNPDSVIGYPAAAAWQ
jgi:AmmeMemoRadiSam system protein B